MELDLTRLDNLAFADFPPIEKTVAESSPTSPLQHEKEKGITPLRGAKDSTESHAEGGSAQAEILPLYRRSEQRKQDHQRSLQVYQTYQHNISRSGTLQSDILKGLSAGEDIYRLFLKAVEAIALMTNDNQLLVQAEGDIREVYGVSLQKERSLQLELEAVEQRLFNLEEAILWETDGDKKKRIQRAIEAHYNRAEEIRKKIADAQATRSS